MLKRTSCVYDNTFNVTRRLARLLAFENCSKTAQKQECCFKHQSSKMPQNAPKWGPFVSWVTFKENVIKMHRIDSYLCHSFYIVDQRHRKVMIPVSKMSIKWRLNTFEVLTGNEDIFQSFQTLSWFITVWRVRMHNMNATPHPFKRGVLEKWRGERNEEMALQGGCNGGNSGGNNECFNECFNEECNERCNERCNEQHDKGGVSSWKSMIDWWAHMNLRWLHYGYVEGFVGRCMGE